jgi:hypothetical protein
LNQESRDLPFWLKVVKVVAESIGLIILPFLIFYLTDKNTREYREKEERLTKELKERDEKFIEDLKRRESADRQAAVDKEIGVRYTEISVAILRESPSKQTREIREWAIDIFKKYSPIPLTPKFIEELKQKPLPISVSYTMKGGVVAGGSADVKFQHAPEPKHQ